MSQPKTDDLFESSNMTFGEHLDELRKALIRTIYWVIGGFAIGVFIANYVVLIVESPLRAALGKYFNVEDIERLELERGQKLSEVEVELVQTKGMTFEWLHVEREDLRNLQHELGEARTAGSAAESASVEATPQHGPLLSDDMMRIRVWKPLRTRISALSAQEAFMIWVKAALVSGIVVASPMIFFHLWSFVAAGLYPHERQYVYIYVPFSVVLFLAGVCLAFFFVFEPVLDFLFSFNRRMGIDPDPRISEWIKFVLILPLGFGVSFQLPLVMLVSNRIGLVSIETYLSQWRMAIMAIVVLSALLTPADPVSMTFMAVPLSFLYFLGIGLCKWTPAGTRNPFPEGRDPQ